MTPGEKANALNAKRRKLLEQADKELADILSPAPDAPTGPTGRVALNQTYSQIAAGVAQFVPYASMFRRCGRYVTIEVAPDQQSYEEVTMTPKRFVTWVEQHVIFTKTRQEESPITSLSEAQANYVLASDVMRHATPELRDVSLVRLPVLKPGTTLERPAFIPAPVGYNADNHVYTIDSLPFDWSKLFPVGAVVNALLQIFDDFPLDGGDIPHRGCRSMGAIVTALLGQFLRHNIDRFPVILLNANQEGTGKTFLARALLAPFYGAPSPTNYKADDNEMSKTLNAAALAGDTYCFLDDVPSLVSNAVNRFVTTDKIRDRLLGGNDMFKAEHRMQFYVTGNNLKTSKDVERRSLPIDMFCGESAGERVLKHHITESRILLGTWRADILQALWSLTAGWVKAGCPRAARERVSSFDAYQIAAHIAVWAGFMDPFGPRQVELDTGDAMQRALIEVITAIADSIQPPDYDPQRAHTGLTETLTVEQIRQKAEAMAKLDIVTNGAREPLRSLGHQLRAIKGRTWTDSMGRRFECGNKRTSAASCYVFSILSEPLVDSILANDPDDTGYSI